MRLYSCSTICTVQNRLQCGSHIACCSSWGVGDILFELSATSLLKITQQHILKTSGNGDNYWRQLAMFRAEKSYLGNAACKLCTLVVVQQPLVVLWWKVSCGRFSNPLSYVNMRIYYLCYTEFYTDHNATILYIQGFIILSLWPVAYILSFNTLTFYFIWRTGVHATLKPPGSSGQHNACMRPTPSWVLGNPVMGTAAK
jgi:hypothetical protein